MLGRVDECNVAMQAEKKRKDETAAVTASLTDKAHNLSALQAKFDKMSQENEM